MEGGCLGPCPHESPAADLFARGDLLVFIKLVLVILEAIYFLQKSYELLILGFPVKSVLLLLLKFHLSLFLFLSELLFLFRIKLFEVLVSLILDVTSR